MFFLQAGFVLEEAFWIHLIEKKVSFISVGFLELQLTRAC